MAGAAEASLRRRELLWRALFWLAVFAGVVLALWPHRQPETPWFLGEDKGEHALSFAVLAWVGVRAGYRRVVVLAVGLLALGGAIEVAQSFTATRTAEWLDWLADGVGIALGCSVVALEARWRAARSLRLKQEHRR